MIEEKKLLEDCLIINEIYEKLAEYEDLEEQGLLTKLPCTVYSGMLRKYREKTGRHYDIESILEKLKEDETNG